MAPRRKAAGKRQTAVQPEWLKQEMGIVRDYRTAQRQMLEAMRAERNASAPKPKKVRRKPKKRHHCTDPAMIRRSNRARQTSKRVGSPFVLPSYRKMHNTVKVEEATSPNLCTVKQESPGMQIQQKGAMENVEKRRRTQRQVDMSSSLRRSRRQRQQPPQAPYSAVALRPRRKRKTIGQEDIMENAATPLGSILSYLNIEGTRTSGNKEFGMQTSPCPAKPQQCDAATNYTPPPSDMNPEVSCQTETPDFHCEKPQVTVESGTQTESNIINTNTSTETATQTHDHPITTPQPLIDVPSNQHHEPTPPSSLANVRSEIKTQTVAEATHVTPVPLVQPLQKDDKNNDTVAKPLLKLVDEHRTIRFTKCTTAAPELRIQSRFHPTKEHVYGLKISPWSSIAHHCCLVCNRAFVTFEVTDLVSGNFRILEGEIHGRKCTRPFEEGLPHQNVRIFESRLFAKADSAFFSNDMTKLMIFRPGSNIYFTLQNSFATYNRYIAKCACAAPAVVKRSAVWVNYGHVMDCPTRRRIETDNNNVGIAESTVLALQKKITRKSKALRVIRPKRSSTVRRQLSATIDDVIESVVHPPAKTTERAPSVEIIEVKQPEARQMLAPADLDQASLTLADVSFDFSPLGSNISIASSLADSGVFSVGQISQQASFDIANRAPTCRRASEPIVGNIGSDVVNPMDWLKHRLSLPLDGHSGRRRSSNEASPTSLT